MDIIIAGGMACLAMDSFQRLLFLTIGQPPSNWAVVGRWAHILLRTGRLYQPEIEASPAVPREGAFGWFVHYVVGIGYAVIYAGLMSSGVLTDSFTDGVYFGMASVIVPWFFFLPVMGKGVLGLHTDPVALFFLRMIIIYRTAETRDNKSRLGQERLVVIAAFRQFGSAAVLRHYAGPVPLSLVLVCVVMIAPLIAIAVAATGDTADLMPHLLQTVLARYVGNTLMLMVGVGLLAVLFGVSSAWVVSRYQFPGRRAFDWLLVLPAAMPAYIIAYSYTDFLEYAGPVQTGLRAVFGWQNARDYWFPEIRSIGGASVMMAAVLYPYIYLLARTAFRQTSTQMFEVAALAGRTVFWSIALPLARPAIVAGLALVLMEVVSDFGTVEYFAIETLTLGITRATISAVPLQSFWMER